MTTFTATRARSTGRNRHNPRTWPSHIVKDFGTIAVSTAPATGDIYQMVRVPKGATIIGGRFYGGALNTDAAVSAYDIDIGWASNTSALGNLGALAQTAIAGFRTEEGYNYPFGGLLLTAGPQLMDIDRIIQLTVNTTVTTTLFTTATLTVEVEYLMTGPI